MTKSVNLAIGGMTCGGCSSRIQTHIGSLPGIIDAKVDLVRECGEFKIDDELMTVEHLLSKVKGMGFTCSVQGVSFQQHVIFGCEANLYAKFEPALLPKSLAVDRIRSVVSKWGLEPVFHQSASRRAPVICAMELSYDAVTTKIFPLFECLSETLKDEFKVKLTCSSRDSDRLAVDIHDLKYRKNTAIKYLVALCVLMALGRVNSGSLVYESAFMVLLSLSVYTHWLWQHKAQLLKLQASPMELFTLFNASACVLFGGLLCSLELEWASSFREDLHTGNLTELLTLTPNLKSGALPYFRSATMLLAIYSFGQYLHFRLRTHALRDLTKLSQTNGQREVKVVTAVLPLPERDLSFDKVVRFNSWSDQIPKLIKDECPDLQLVGLHSGSRKAEDPALIKYELRDKSLIALQDIVLVEFDKSIPCDGMYLTSTAESPEMAVFEESLLTGEDAPVPKGIGGAVYEGSLVRCSHQDGYAAILVKQVGSGTRLGQIERSLNLGSFVDSNSSRFVNNFVRCILVVVCMAATSAWIYWSIAVRLSLVQVPLIYGVSRGIAKFAFVLRFGASVLAMACPCAVGLAIPLTVAVAVAAAARRGVIVKESSALWTGGKVDTVVLDKTGTLTQGLAKVVRVTLYKANLAQLGVSENPLITMSTLITRLEEKSVSKHAYALLRFVSRSLIPAVEIRACEVREIVGEGTEMIFVNQSGVQFEAFLGSRQFTVKRLSLDLAEDQRAAIYLSVRNVGVVAEFELSHSVTDSVKTAVENLQKKYEVWLCSGDTSTNTRDCAKQLGIADGRIVSDASPWQKEQLVKDLAAAGKVVAMVGDGVNDSLALRAAAVSFAIGYSNELVTAAAQVVTLKADVRGVFHMLHLCKQASRLAKLNLSWAVAFNLLAVPIAAGLFYPRIWINSVQASLCMAFSSLCVLVSSLVCLRLALRMWPVALDERRGAVECLSPRSQDLSMAPCSLSNRSLCGSEINLAGSGTLLEDSTWFSQTV